MNARRFASCGVPPQFTDDEIDRQLESADAARHLSHCRRPPLGQCTEREFEEDLYAFLAERGEGELANDLRNKRINWRATHISFRHRAVLRCVSACSSESGNTAADGYQAVAWNLPTV